MDEERQYSIGELARAADVSVRTIRYYAAEGLLPPVLSGPRAVYTSAHLDRLRLIGELKARFLPLKEIKRQLDELEHGGRDDSLRDDVDKMTMPSAPPPETRSKRAVVMREDPSDAADYIANVLGRDRIDRPSRPAAVPPSASWRRIPLGTDAELLIENGTYERRKEAVAWLIEWARRNLN